MIKNKNFRIKTITERYNVYQGFLILKSEEHANAVMKNCISTQERDIYELKNNGYRYNMSIISSYLDTVDNKKSFEEKYDFANNNYYRIIHIYINNDSYVKSSFILTDLDTYSSYTEVMEVLNYYDPKETVPLFLVSDGRFLVEYITDNINRNRKLGSSEYYDSPKECKDIKYIGSLHDSATINMHNARNFNREYNAETIFEITMHLFKNKMLRKQNMYNLIEVFETTNYGYSSFYKVIKSCIFNDDLFDEEDRLFFLQQIVNVYDVTKEYTGLFNIFTNKFLSNHIDLIFEKLCKCKAYDMDMTNFFLEYKDIIDVSKVNKLKFIKAASAESYANLSGIVLSKKVSNMTKMIENSDKNNLNSNLIIMTLFLNTYSLDELKELDLQPLTDAFYEKISGITFVGIMKYTDLSTFLETKADLENINYFFDVLVNKTMASRPRTIKGKLDLVYKNLSKDRKVLNVFDILMKRVPLSEDVKVTKALLNYNI